MNTPRSTVSAAALGRIEVSGKAVGPHTLVSPLSQTDCLYYRVVVEPNPQGELHERMQEVCAPLFLDDGTGKLMIYPEGCELRLKPTYEGAEYGDEILAIAGKPSEIPELAREYCIRPGDEIFVLGTLQENPWMKKDPVAEWSKLSRIGPGFVSENEADLLRRKAFPLLDPAIPSGVTIASPVEFDLHPHVILMKDHGPFVISTDSERDVVAKLHWKSLLYIWGGGLVAVWGLWEILSYAKAAGLLPGDS